MATTKKVEDAEFNVDEMMEELVTIRLPIIPGKEKQEAQYVAVNGREWVIPRGVDYQIPRYAAKVLQESEEEQIRAALYRDAMPYRR